MLHLRRAIGVIPTARRFRFLVAEPSRLTQLALECHLSKLTFPISENLDFYIRFDFAMAGAAPNRLFKKINCIHPSKVGLADRP
jgi:hypothetical protein